MHKKREKKEKDRQTDSPGALFRIELTSNEPFSVLWGNTGAISESHPVCNTHPSLDKSRVSKITHSHTQKPPKNTQNSPKKLLCRCCPAPGSSPGCAGPSTPTNPRQKASGFVFKGNLLLINHVLPLARHLLPHNSPPKKVQHRAAKGPQDEPGEAHKCS